MTQRSFTNERYRKDAKIGSTRKSASSAKPVRKQGSAESSVKASGEKAKKSGPKQKVLPKDGIERDWAGLPTSPRIQKWRRAWWALLLTGLAVIGGSYLVPELRNNEDVARVASILVLALSMTAISIDLIIIRKLRKELIAEVERKKTGKKSPKSEPGKSEPRKSESGKSESGKGEPEKKGKDAS